MCVCVCVRVCVCVCVKHKLRKQRNAHNIFSNVHRIFIFNRKLANRYAWRWRDWIDPTWLNWKNDVKWSLKVVVYTWMEYPDMTIRKIAKELQLTTSTVSRMKRCFEMISRILDYWSQVWIWKKEKPCMSWDRETDCFREIQIYLCVRWQQNRCKVGVQKMYKLWYICYFCYITWW